MSLLHLNGNRFSGIVPQTFKDLISLTELDLSNNQFSSSFASVMLLMPNLIYLDLRFNFFSRKLPQELFNKKLDVIFLNNNQFEGQLPQHLGNSPASIINLANNKFSGSIPASLGHTNTQLKEILFLDNQLTGYIPEGVGLFTDMQVLDVSYNSLMGHLLDSISCLEDIEVLNLAHNKLSREWPDLECTKLFLRSGVDFSGNCIPRKGMPRPQPQCSEVLGGVNCLRISSAKPIVCGSLLDILLNQPNPLAQRDTEIERGDFVIQIGDAISFTGD
ncbi:hypothetical protein Ancab_028506, partial [Ancistrocladus abbreviatus]